MENVIYQPAEITKEWLTAALRSSGAIQSSVTHVDSQVIGEGVGLMAQLARLSVTYANPEKAPTTMIAKFAAANENKAVAQLLDFYTRETNFYNNLGADCPLRVPASYFGRVDQSSYDFVLLLEDLGDVSPNDQLVGASEAEAYAAIDRIAQLHATWWQKVRSPENRWMYDLGADASINVLQNLLYMPSMPPTLEKFPEFFDAKRRDLCRRVGERFPEFWSQRISPHETFIHGDYRQDNMIYPKDSLDAIVIDWQISGMGKPIFDVTYFICQSLQPALRKAIERPLLAFYVARLQDHGVLDYSLEQAWQDYRMMVLACLLYPMVVCGSLDLSNPRGKLLADCMLERNLVAIDELGSAEFVD